MTLTTLDKQSELSPDIKKPTTLDNLGLYLKHLADSGKLTTDQAQKFQESINKQQETHKSRSNAFRGDKTDEFVMARETGTPAFIDRLKDQMDNAARLGALKETNTTVALTAPVEVVAKTDIAAQPATALLEKARESARQDTVKAISDLKSSTDDYKKIMTNLLDPSALPPVVQGGQIYSGADMLNTLKLGSTNAGDQTKLVDLVESIAGQKLTGNPDTDIAIAKTFHKIVMQRINVLSDITAIGTEGGKRGNIALALVLSEDKMERYVTKLLADERWQAGAEKNRSKTMNIGSELEKVGLGFLLEATKLPIYISTSNSRYTAPEKSLMGGVNSVNDTGSVSGAIRPYVGLSSTGLDAGVSFLATLGSNGDVNKLDETAKEAGKWFSYIFDANTASVKSDWKSSVPSEISDSKEVMSLMWDIAQRFTMFEKVSPGAKGNSETAIEVRKNILRYLTTSVVDGAANLKAGSIVEGSKFNGVQLGLHVSLLRLLATTVLWPLAFVTVGGKTSNVKTSVAHDLSTFADIQDQIVGLEGGSKQNLSEYLALNGLIRHKDNKGFDFHFDSQKINLAEFTTTYTPDTADVSVTEGTNTISVKGSPKFKINLEKKTIEIIVTEPKSQSIAQDSTSRTDSIWGDKDKFAAELQNNLSKVRNTIITHYNRSGLRTNDKHLKALEGMSNLHITDAWNVFLKVPGVKKIIGTNTFTDDQKVALLQEIKNETAGYILSRNFPIATGDTSKDTSAIKRFIKNFSGQIQSLPREYQADIRKGDYGALMLALEAKKYSIDGGKSSTNAQESAAKLLGIDPKQYQDFRKNILSKISSRTIVTQKSVVRAQLFNQQQGSKGFDVNDRASDVLDGSIVPLSSADWASKFMYDKAENVLISEARSLATIKKTMNALLAKMEVVDSNKKAIDLTDSQVKDAFTGKSLVLNGSTVQFKKELSFAMFHACANDEFALTKLTVDVTPEKWESTTYSVDEPELFQPAMVARAGVMSANVQELGVGVGMNIATRELPVAPGGVVPPGGAVAPTLPGAVANPGATVVIPNAPVINI